MPLDITGQRFGRWTAVKRAASRNGKACWLCQCDCGDEKEILIASLRSGRSTSCGCYQKEATSKRATTHGGARDINPTPEYRSWQSAKNRCFNPANPRYKDYGGRDILMCEAWADDFAAFFAYIGPRPPGTSLDRIENDKGYEPGNCRWATRSQQDRNKRNTIFVEYDGRKIPVAELAEITGHHYNSLRRLIKGGCTVQEALGRTRPRKPTPEILV